MKHTGMLSALRFVLIGAGLLLLLAVLLAGGNDPGRAAAPGEASTATATAPGPTAEAAPDGRTDVDIEDTLPYCTVEYILSDEWHAGDLRMVAAGTYTSRVILAVRGPDGDWCFWVLSSDRISHHMPNRPGQGGR